MKRLLLRLSALSLVVMLGLIAIAHAQRSNPLGGDPVQPANTDPFASSHNQPGATDGDAANPSNSSVRLVSVQDFPADPGTVPPRSVPTTQEPGNESQLTIHQSRPTNDREPAMDSVAAPSDPFGLHNGGGASLASATAACRCFESTAGRREWRSHNRSQSGADCTADRSRASPRHTGSTARRFAAANPSATIARRRVRFLKPRCFNRIQPAGQAPLPPADAGPTIAPMATQPANPPGMTIGSSAARRS